MRPRGELGSRPVSMYVGHDDRQSPQCTQSSAALAISAASLRCLAVRSVLGLALPAAEVFMSIDCKGVVTAGPARGPGSALAWDRAPSAGPARSPSRHRSPGAGTWPTRTA